MLNAHFASISRPITVAPIGFKLALGQTAFELLMQHLFPCLPFVSTFLRRFFQTTNLGVIGRALTLMWFDLWILDGSGIGPLHAGSPPNSAGWHRQGFLQVKYHDNKLCSRRLRLRAHSDSILPVLNVSLIVPRCPNIALQFGRSLLLTLQNHLETQAPMGEIKAVRPSFSRG